MVLSPNVYEPPIVATAWVKALAAFLSKHMKAIITYYPIGTVKQCGQDGSCLHLFGIMFLSR